MSRLTGHGGAEAARRAAAGERGQPQPRQDGQLPAGLVRLMAVTCAVTVANLYYAQPLLHSIAGSLHAAQGSASLLVTAGQAGYAAGLLLIVPAGDITRRRPLLTGLLAICSVTLAGCAVAPTLPVLGVAAALAGVTSVVVQMLVPYAATLASDAERGKVIGTLMGGLLIGILLSRTFAGVVAGLAGWRAVYVAAAVMMAVTTIALRRALPDHGPQLSISYPAQLRGVLDIARAEPALRWRSLIAASGFGSFACFWTTVTFLLASPQYGFTQLEIGLFALVGAGGAATAMASGRVLDARPGLRWPVTGILLVLLTASYIPIGLGGAHLGGWSLALLVAGVLVMDACVQGAHVTNQAVIYDLLPQARSRLTTVYITTMFAGGAAGSAAGAQAYEHWGWSGATLTAAAFPVLGLACWLGARRPEQQAADHDDKGVSPVSLEQHQRPGGEDSAGTGAARAARDRGRTQITRLAEYASTERQALDRLLDEVFVGHVALVRPDGFPVIVPTAIARDGDRLLVHGSTGSRWMRAVAAGAPVCVEVTAADGIIVARSAFESSLRYRSAVLFGTCERLEGPDKEAALDVLTERLIPGRAAEVRRPTDKELAATLVLALPITEWSLKVSDGWPGDPPEDVAGDAWAGVVPLAVAYRDATPAPDLRPGIEIPPSVRRLAGSG